MLSVLFRKWVLKSLSTFLFTGFLFVQSIAQTDSVSINQSPNQVFAARLMYGSIVIHTNLIANTSGANPRAAEFEISKQFRDSITWRKCYCYPRTGVTISIADLNTPILGKAYSAAYFIEPNYRTGRNSSIFLKGGAGLSYLTNPFDSLKNPENHTYSLAINFYLALGAGISYHVSPRISLGAMLSFQHNSNGDFERPNRGINWYGGSLALRYHASNNKLERYKKETDKSWKKEKTSLEAGAFYSPKVGYNVNGVRQRKMVTGATLQFTKRVSLISALSLSAELYYDAAMASTKRLYNDRSSSVLAGILAGHQFVFRRIIFSQQLGIYTHKQTKALETFNQTRIQLLYHRWGLLYKLNSHFYSGFNLLAHKNVADFVDARLLYRFTRR